MTLQHDHDHHEGQRVSRRTVFAGISSIGFGALVAACGGETPTEVTTSTGATVTPEATSTTAADLSSLFGEAGTCTLTAAATQGPYYFDADKIRSDIREDREGTRLRVAIKLQDSEACAPMPNAVVEIWHCDAVGLYSGAEAASTGGAAGPIPTDDKRYLRGAQVTNADGIVEFVTIWPGWYRGRTTHIHAMVHVDNNRVLTTQIMFDEAMNSRVYQAAPYSARTGRNTFNDNDNIYRASMLMKTIEDGDGYLGAIVFSADSDSDGQ